MTFPAMRSEPINFEEYTMQKLDIENVLNPYQYNLENVQKELNVYKEKF